MNEMSNDDPIPTPTLSGVPLRRADFRTLAQALDYAAAGDSGFNYYDGRDRLAAVLPYHALRERALALALRLAPLGRGERVALVAHTHPDFAVVFYACQYAGLVPVPLPAAVHLGGRSAYVRHLRLMLRDCRAIAAFAPPEFAGFLAEAGADLPLAVAGTLDDLMALAPAPALPPAPAPDELAYLQYTSGSTRFPRGTMITQAAVMANLRSIFNEGLSLRSDDRMCSWLPHYHDMGLVGMLLGCVATQRTVDFIPTRDFAMRPRQWLKLISRNRATISFSPPFGYTLCTRRLRPGDLESLDLGCWRIAGVGAEMIHPASLQSVAELLKPAGFDEKAFLPCYGMAECSLAVSFSPQGAGALVDTVDLERLSRDGEASALAEGAAGARAKSFVDCGKPLSEFEVEVRDAAGHPLPDRRVGRLFLRGPSVMTGYFDNAEASRQALTPDAWLDTGDLAYRVGGSIFVTGRARDLMIIKGRNLWPQDLEHLAELQPGVRTSDVSAFAVDDGEGDAAVLVVQVRETDADRLADLVDRLQQEIQAEFGIRCVVDLVPPHTLPHTSSGKLSRSMARAEYLARRGQAAEAMPEIALPDAVNLLPAAAERAAA
jgi:fatty-acyl-CoA synthase